jgi:hypothetical protein
MQARCSRRLWDCTGPTRHVYATCMQAATSPACAPYPLSLQHLPLLMELISELNKSRSLLYWRVWLTRATVSPVTCTAVMPKLACLTFTWRHHNDLPVLVPAIANTSELIIRAEPCLQRPPSRKGVPAAAQAAYPAGRAAGEAAYHPIGPIELILVKNTKWLLAYSAKQPSNAEFCDFPRHSEPAAAKIHCSR